MSVIRYPESELTCACFGRTDDLVICGSADGFISTWTVRGRVRELAKIKAHNRPVVKVIMTYSGSVIVSLGDDGFVNLYAIEDLILQARLNNSQ